MTGLPVLGRITDGSPILQVNSSGYIKNMLEAIRQGLSLMGQGIDNSPVVPLEESPEAKSIGHSMTLERDETDRRKLRSYLLQLSEMAGRSKKGELPWIGLVLRHSWA